MIDPITAIAGATAAFNTLKKGIQVGKDLQDMGGTMAKWAGAVADLDFADKQNQKPPWYKALGGGVEAQAMEIFAAKQKAASMRAELKDFISVVYGPSKWQEILEIEAKLRNQKTNGNQTNNHRMGYRYFTLYYFRWPFVRFCMDRN